MWQKIVNKLEQGKKYILELIDQSTAAYDQREELCNKIQTLRDKGLTESTLHMQVIFTINYYLINSLFYYLLLCRDLFYKSTTQSDICKPIIFFILDKHHIL